MGLQDIYIQRKGEATALKTACIVGVWGAGLPHPNDKDIFKVSMEDDELSHRELHNIYIEAGASFGLTSLKEHRNGNCICH